MRQWSPESWTAAAVCEQQPDWPDPAALHRVTGRLRALPPLVTVPDVMRLKDALALACRGEAFVLQAGDCAETFEALTAPSLHRRIRVILQMASVLGFVSGLPVIKVGRIAGQLGKPRSEPFERLDGPDGSRWLPSYRGDMVNGLEPTDQARSPDPNRLIRAYFFSAAVLNVLRSLDHRGFSDIGRMQRWMREFVDAAPHGPARARFAAFAAELDHAVRFQRATGGALDLGVQMFTSHEALILPYEQALTRWDPERGAWHATSGHLLWIGERTRRLDGAHVRFLSGVDNPIGVKIGPSATPSDVVALCRTLNPRRVPGRLTLITRMGAGRIAGALPPLIRAVRVAGEPVVWVCDPMHGNTYRSPVGVKTRSLADITAEVRAFFAVHRAEGSHPGGIHLELSGDDVTECVGGLPGLREAQLRTRYETACDPRLNPVQSMELAFLVAGLLAGSQSAEQPTARGDERGMEPGGRAETVQDVGDVAADRPLADAEDLRDLGVAMAEGH